MRREEAKEQIFKMQGLKLKPYTKTLKGPVRRWSHRRTAKGGQVTREEKLIVNRLKATFADVDEMRAVFDIVTKTLALREAELTVAKALCTRAADALEKWNYIDGHSVRDLYVDGLIAELRKAAK